MGVIAMLLMFFEISDFAEKVSSSEYGFLLNKGLGYYLMIIGSVGIVISGVGKMIMKKNR